MEWEKCVYWIDTLGANYLDAMGKGLWGDTLGLNRCQSVMDHGLLTRYTVDAQPLVALA